MSMSRFLSMIFFLVLVFATIFVIEMANPRSDAAQLGLWDRFVRNIGFKSRKIQVEEIRLAQEKDRLEALRFLENNLSRISNYQDMLNNNVAFQQQFLQNDAKKSLHAMANLNHIWVKPDGPDPVGVNELMNRFATQIEGLERRTDDLKARIQAQNQTIRDQYDNLKQLQAQKEASFEMQKEMMARYEQIARQQRELYDTMLQNSIHMQENLATLRENMKSANSIGDPAFDALRQRMEDMRRAQETTLANMRSVKDRQASMMLDLQANQQRYRDTYREKMEQYRQKSEELSFWIKDNNQRMKDSQDRTRDFIEKSQDRSEDQMMAMRDKIERDQQKNDDNMQMMRDKIEQGRQQNRDNMDRLKEKMRDMQNR